MKTEKSIVCGQRIRKIRNYLGLTQEEFGKQLGEWGIYDRSGNRGRSPEIVASWESGRNQVPDSVLSAIRENVNWEGEKINWSFLTGESEYITYSPRGIIEETFRTLEDYQKNTSNWVSADINELANDPINKLAVSLMDDILPALGYSKWDIVDWSRFTKYMQENIRTLIDNHIIKLDNDEK